MPQIIIVGTGLSGLLTATHLQRAGYTPMILEARKRIGGRILSISAENISPKFDLGPAWIWPHHQHILQLLRDLDLAIYQQYETGAGIYEQSTTVAPRAFTPEWQQPLSYRIVGGVSTITDRLASQLPADCIQLNQTVTAVLSVENGVQVVVKGEGNSAEKSHIAQHAIITLPPHLAATTIDYQPALPTDLHQVMTTTPTWMGMAMKVILLYDNPFWRERDLSGLAISHVGPVAQFHDATPHDHSVGALFGWIGDHSPSRQQTHAERKAAVIAQAVRMFGAAAATPHFYAELNWSQEPTTTNLINNPIAQEHPTYGHPLLQTPHMAGHLHWAVTEASPIEGGYLDGCVVIANRVAERVLVVLGGGVGSKE